MATRAPLHSEVPTAKHIGGLTPDEQLAFWQALEQPVSLTPRQRELGRIMRGER